jgi:hypothetical protein
MEKTGSISKGNISINEYAEGSHQYEDKFFIKCGVAGLFANKQELQDLFLVLNYYLNIDKFAECEVKVGDQNVAIQ